METLKDEVTRLREDIASLKRLFQAEKKGGDEFASTGKFETGARYSRIGLSYYDRKCRLSHEEEKCWGTNPKHLYSLAKEISNR